MICRCLTNSRVGKFFGFCGSDCVAGTEGLGRSLGHACAGDAKVWDLRAPVYWVYDRASGGWWMDACLGDGVSLRRRRLQARAVMSAAFFLKEWDLIFCCLTPLSRLAVLVSTFSPLSLMQHILNLADILLFIYRCLLIVLFVTIVLVLLTVFQWL